MLSAEQELRMLCQMIGVEVTFGAFPWAGAKVKVRLEWVNEDTFPWVDRKYFRSPKTALRFLHSLSS